MAEAQPHRSLLEEIDSRQDDVLAQLDRLNARIESLLKAVMATRVVEEETPVAA